MKKIKCWYILPAQVHLFIQGNIIKCFFIFDTVNPKFKVVPNVLKNLGTQNPLFMLKIKHTQSCLLIHSTDSFLAQKYQFSCQEGINIGILFDGVQELVCFHSKININ